MSDKPVEHIEVGMDTTPQDFSGLPTQQPDYLASQEFMNATPERRKFAVASSRVEHVARRYHDALATIVRQAAVLGLRIEIRTVSNWPPAMGNVSSEVEVRPSLALWREIEQLAEDAYLSELTDDERAAARGDECTPPQSSPN